MSKSQVLILVALGLIACAVIAAAGVVFYTFSNSQQVAEVPPPPSPAPAPTATPTITPTPLELPTGAAQDQDEPTPTNTPVVAATPSPTPGKSFGQQLTGHTREPNQNTSESDQAASGPDVRFWADNTSLQAGGCTNLHWHVEGVSAYWIDGQPGAGPDGEFHICPSKSETHILKYDESVNGLLRSKEIQVSISVAARPESSGSSGSGSSGGGTSSGGAGGSGGGSVVAEFDTDSGTTGMSGYTEPYSIGIMIYDDNRVLVSWAGCGVGAEWTTLKGNKIELQDGSADQLPYFLISAIWEGGDVVTGRTEMFSIDAGAGYICNINDVFMMR